MTPREKPATEEEQAELAEKLDALREAAESRLDQQVAANAKDMDEERKKLRDAEKLAKRRAKRNRANKAARKARKRNRR